MDAPGLQWAAGVGWPEHGVNPVQFQIEATAVSRDHSLQSLEPAVMRMKE